MKPFSQKIKLNFFDKSQDFRIRLFHILAFGGIAVSFFTVIISLATRMWRTAALAALLIVFSLALVVFTQKTRKYKLAYLLTIIVVFMLILPMMFFTSGGHRSGMPSVFLLAVMFTVLMLKGRAAILISVLEIAEYSAVCIAAYYYPAFVSHFETETEILVDIIFAFTCVSLICGTLKNLTAKDIQEFYLRELERVSASSVIHYHANIHKALKYAVKIDLIDVNPADKVERPKKDRYVGSFYDADEVNALFEAAKGTKLELPILFGAFYGLRRSEAIGLKWDAIDFDQNTITIRHTVTSCDLDGKRILVAADTTKTKSSMRTLPLVPFMRERLLALREEQKENRRLCGRSYIKDYVDYVCVNEIGDLIKPHYVTESFPKLLKANGLRPVRYHDLRHPYVKSTTKKYLFFLVPTIQLS